MTERHSAPGTAGDGVVTVGRAGELDLHHARELREALLRPIHAGARGVVADLTATTFCDSTVFSVLVEVHRHAAERNVPFAIAAGEIAVVRPLQILGLDRVLPLHTGLDTALAAVEGRAAAGCGDAPGASAARS